MAEQDTAGEPGKELDTDVIVTEMTAAEGLKAAAADLRRAARYAENGDRDHALMEIGYARSLLGAEEFVEAAMHEPADEELFGMRVIVDPNHVGPPTMFSVEAEIERHVREQIAAEIEAYAEGFDGKAGLMSWLIDPSLRTAVLEAAKIARRTP